LNTIDEFPEIRQRLARGIALVGDRVAIFMSAVL